MGQEDKTALEGIKAQIDALNRDEEGVFILEQEERCQVYPAYALYETRLGKKAGYADIAGQLARLGERLEQEYTPAGAAAYVETAEKTLEAMSPELYEYYEHVLALLRRTVKMVIQKENLQMAAFPVPALKSEMADTQKEAYLRFGEAVLAACSHNFILAEKYEALGKCLTKEADFGNENKKQKNDGPQESPLQQPGETVGVRFVMCTARSATIEITDGGRYFTKKPYTIYVNGEAYGESGVTITGLYGLVPDTVYCVSVRDGEAECASVTFTTDKEFITLDVKKFGARGDGVQDDTHFIQAAIMACPREGRVLIPAGTYRINSLFLKSNLRLELAKGAELVADTDRTHYPQFPGSIQSEDEKSEYFLGTWEGNPLPMFSGIICGVDVENVVLYGEGTINGNASAENWWHDPKTMRIAFRPRLFFIRGCKNITLQGLTFRNSPSWTLHPFFSSDLRFIGVNVQNPSDSPNTDGLDPESCKNVEILGVRFSLGDDCIAVKSGKIYMGKKYKTPCENLHIRQCLMENGHGAVTVGSEMAGGVLNMTVEDCLFRHTDRGLRIKTRRGRGRDAILDGISFRNLTLDHVMTPLVVNSFYFCDPDGKTEYVQSREPYPVDERTPSVRRLTFENMECTNCHVAAAFFDGLPEEKIAELVMRNVSISYAEEPKCDVPAMSEGVEKSTKRGLFARNVKKLVLDNVQIIGQDGPATELIGVDELTVKE